MTRPTRLQLSRKKGFDLQAHSRAVNGLPAVSVARPGKWGNPFVIGHEYLREKTPDGDRVFGTVTDAEQAVALYRRFVAREVSLRVAVYRELTGKNLACWCGHDVMCHADVLLGIINQDIRDHDG